MNDHTSGALQDQRAAMRGCRITDENAEEQLNWRVILYKQSSSTNDSNVLAKQYLSDVSKQQKKNGADERLASTHKRGKHHSFEQQHNAQRQRKMNALAERYGGTHEKRVWFATRLAASATMTPAPSTAWLSWRSQCWSMTPVLVRAVMAPPVLARLRENVVL